MSCSKNLCCDTSSANARREPIATQADMSPNRIMDFPSWLAVPVGNLEVTVIGTPMYDSDGRAPVPPTRKPPVAPPNLPNTVAAAYGEQKNRALFQYCAGNPPIRFAMS